VTAAAVRTSVTSKVTRRAAQWVTWSYGFMVPEAGAAAQPTTMPPQRQRLDDLLILCRLGYAQRCGCVCHKRDWWQANGLGALNAVPGQRRTYES
jgi:hypothetical protein